MEIDIEHDMRTYVLIHTGSPLIAETHSTTQTVPTPIYTHCNRICHRCPLYYEADLTGVE